MPKLRRKTKRPAIFLDRDGVINASPEHRYVAHWDQFHFLPGTLEALRRLNQNRQIVIVVSNQSGVGRKVLSRIHLAEITQKMLQAVRSSGGWIRAVYYCTHHPENDCACRKPRVGLLKKAARQFSIDLSRSFMVGDTETDILMAHSAGCRSVLALSGKQTRSSARHLTVAPDQIAENLLEAVRWILREQRSP